MLFLFYTFLWNCSRSQIFSAAVTLQMFTQSNFALDSRVRGNPWKFVYQRAVDWNPKNTVLLQNSKISKRVMFVVCSTLTLSLLDLSLSNQINSVLFHVWCVYILKSMLNFFHVSWNLHFHLCISVRGSLVRQQKTPRSCVHSRIFLCWNVGRANI